MLKKWSDFRRRQREILSASNTSTTPEAAAKINERDVTAAEGAQVGATEDAKRLGAAKTQEPPKGDLLTDILPLGVDIPGSDVPGADIPESDVPGADLPESDVLGRGVPGTDAPESSRRRDFGTAGRPLNRQSPFYVGFVGAFGVLVAYGLFRALGQLTQVITLLVVAFFLTLALNPLVEALSKRGLRRSLSVTIVFVGLIAVFTAIGFAVVPPVAQQGALLAESAPKYLDNLRGNRLIQDLDGQYQVLEKFQAEFEKLVTDGTFMSGVFGGVLGAGKALASGFFALLTVLVLTLYFLSSLPKVKHAAYGMVPSSRRARVISLSEEIMRRVGSYAIGQVAVATINAVFSWIMMSVVGIRYAAVLAVVVGFLGLIPMVGATIGAAVVCLVAVFDDPTKALIALVYYVIYQQLENYVVAPRIMQRTVSVPGAVTVIAALAGATLLGMLGALLAIPVAAGLLLIYEEVLLPRQHQT